MNNTSCVFYTDEKWLALVKEQMSLSSGIGRASLEFGIHSAPIFDMMVRCTNFVMDSENKTQENQDMSARHWQLLADLEESGRYFFDWYHDWVTDTAQPDSEQLSNLTMRRKENMHLWLADFMGTCKIPILLHGRMRVALGRNRAAVAEQQCQMLAQKLAAIRRSKENTAGFQEPYVLRSIYTSILATAEDWMQFSIGVDEGLLHGERMLVGREMYLSWIRQVGINAE